MMSPGGGLVELRMMSPGGGLVELRMTSPGGGLVESRMTSPGGGLVESRMTSPGGSIVKSALAHAIHHRLHNHNVMIWQHYTVDWANSSLVCGRKSLGTRLGLTPARSENTGERRWD